MEINQCGLARFKEIKDPGDGFAVMLVLELRGDHVLVLDLRFYD
jgi:hypothetical protein